ncbi:MAG: Asp-tRNA(Asn)/Glu-tRNA(Gln) amidotransferase subunit GatA [Firmicutes bacterium]|nr:Asp-tRNA(Asn)/Glu-tRNA(Gln) amidotransferase subunit GatA [Bacillota bacterium]HQD39896.1 Asp-tRNA(Asn)/Glu-tRNA(Gln) amidotransferase subunit GatA [Bacillota bacterium]
MELYRKPAHELSKLLAKKEISARELTGQVLEQIELKDKELGAFITVTAEKALETAREVDEKRAKGEELPLLAGIPLALKDNICTKGLRTTCASKMLENYQPPYSATVVEKLSQLPLVGKTNLDEFAMGASTETSFFKPTRNPWDRERVAGGSSGGSAAAVAAGEAVVALGTDTGGSIRQPAAFCGVVGLKPTYGRVSRYGAVAFASSMDQIGPITRSVEDAALMLQEIAGEDPRDAASSREPVADYTSGLKQGVAGMKIGIPKEYLALDLDPSVRQRFDEACKALEDAGASCIEVSLPHTEYAAAVYYIVACGEASSNLARFDGVRFGYRAPDSPDTTTMYSNTRGEGFGFEVKKRILLGTFALSSGQYDLYYSKAQKVRRLVADDFKNAFTKCDCLLAPTTTMLPFKIGEIESLSGQYELDLCTIPANLAGLPALSVPVGLSQGLPVGVQLVGKHFDEETILKVGWALEQCFGPMEVK